MNDPQYQGRMLGHVDLQYAHKIGELYGEAGVRLMPSDRVSTFLGNLF